MTLKSKGRHPDRKPTHPGAVMSEVIESLACGKAEMARRLQISRSGLYKVLDRKSGLTADMAVRFEAVTGTSAHVLMRMQLELDLWLARKEQKAA